MRLPAPPDTGNPDVDAWMRRMIEVLQRGMARRLEVTKTPASAAAAGVAGDICWDADYLYIAVAKDTWKRVAIATWP
jgi:hypothetical protein